MKRKKEDILIIIIDTIINNPYITETELAKITNYSERSIRRFINILKRTNKLQIVGYGRSKKWIVLKW